MSTNNDEESCGNNTEAEDKTLFEQNENLSLIIKDEVLSPDENADDPEELEDVSNNEINFEAVEKITCIKKEVFYEERNEDPLNEDPISVCDNFYIKEEPIIEDTNPICLRQDCEEIRKKNIVENRKKSYKHSPFNYSTDCIDVLPRKKLKRKNESEGDRLMQSAMEGLQILQNHLARPPEDHVEMFMHYIASELRELKSPVNVMEAKQSIFNVVYEIRKRELE